jgi:hypothetical protein
LNFTEKRDFALLQDLEKRCIFVGIKFKVMGKLSREELSLINKDRDALLKLILKKTGISYKRLIDIAKQEFIVDNLDVVTAAEKKQFKHIAV